MLNAIYKRQATTDGLLKLATSLAESACTPLSMPIPGRVAYVVSHGLSYASNGYAVRTQGVARALNEHGLDALCFVRPGRPWELGARRGPVALETVVQGVRYIHSRWPEGKAPQTEQQHLEYSAKKFEELFRVYRPAAVLAASNWIVGLPAWIAARRLGLEFHYEVRGFWEVSRFSREPGWKESPEYLRHRAYESWLCNQADKLYTLNRFMKAELVSRGVRSKRIHVVPNSVTELPDLKQLDTTNLRESLGIPQEAFVLGYVGAITEYEGLELLIQALAKIPHLNTHVLIVGGHSPVDGGARWDPMVEQLEVISKSLGVAEKVTFTGRVPHEAIPKYFALIDATVLPRPPLPVCELVSALKPLEYLAWGKPVIASDVGPQAELLAQGELGWLFAKGDVDALAATIETVINTEVSALKKKADEGRAVVEQSYLWRQAVTPIVNSLYGREITQGQKKLRIACIMDDFTYYSYAPEADLYQLTPAHWQTELTDCQPDFLFIESAWRGKDNLWDKKIGHSSCELQDIISWCRNQEIPTVFWNKEDPIHFETFLNTAKLFDHVFTTDLDCIHRYKAALGHNRVYLLPFACQPKLTNPVETYSRKDAICFAGAYYLRYPDRIKDLENFVEEFLKFKPLEIYDRNFGKKDPNYQFPAKYQPYIVGTMPFNEIDKAYKGYRYAINLNSIKQSQSMFARRVYELLASNTITVSNFSRGLRLLFGDLVLCSDSGAEIIRRLQELESHPEKASKLRLAGLRKVLSEHTYQARLRYLWSKISAERFESDLPTYTVVSLVHSAGELTNIIENVTRQQHRPVKLFVAAAGESSLTEMEHLLAEFPKDIRLECRVINDLKDMLLGQIVHPGTWLASFSPGDYYGPNYLYDFALATRFTAADIIGKGAYYQMGDDGKASCCMADMAYRSEVELAVRASVVAPGAQEGMAGFWFQSVESKIFRNKSQQAIDEFNYCRDAFLTHDLQGADHIKEIQSRVDDAGFDVGMPLAELEQLAEKTPGALAGTSDIPVFSPLALHKIFGNRGTKNLSIRLTDNLELEIVSNLSDGKHEYIYVQDSDDLRLEELTKGQVKNGKLPLHLENAPGLHLSLVIIFFDQSRKRLEHCILQANKNNLLNIPETAATARLGFRIYQSGRCVIKQLLIGHKNLSPPNIIARNDVLMVTNNYPSYDALYKNGFVHSRVKAYLDQDVDVDVFRFRKDEPLSWHEFQDVDVITGSQVALDNLLCSGSYRHVLVHFLDENMWEVLQRYIDRMRVTVWVHGAEVQPWWRRKFNYTTEAELHSAKLVSEKRLRFWHGLFSCLPKNLQFVFVSRYFAQEVFEDVGVSVPPDQYRIIHNPIDVDLFAYHEKPVEQRGKILSIRSFASPKYGNDLSVKAILALRQQPFFDRLEFRIVGDGALFDEITAPLACMRNVIVEKRFLQQQEIAELQRQYGVFLNPTRCDSQGVSRDEAMSAGLVPLTSRNSAIPEFVDEKCGYLVETEDAQGLARAIIELWENPKIFSQKSRAAAERVRRQRGMWKIIAAELALIGIEVGHAHEYDSPDLS